MSDAEYIYLSTEEFSKHTSQEPAAIAPIKPDEIMSMKDLLSLQEATNHRFGFRVDEGGRTVTAIWRDYYVTSSGNYRIDPRTGAASLQDIQRMTIIIGD